MTTTTYVPQTSMLAIIPRILRDRLHAEAAAAGTTTARLLGSYAAKGAGLAVDYPAAPPVVADAMPMAPAESISRAADAAHEVMQQAFAKVVAKQAARKARQRRVAPRATMPDPSSTGARLRELREQLGWSQHAAAAACHVSRSAWGAMELGQRANPATLTYCCGVLAGAVRERETNGEREGVVA